MKKIYLAFWGTSPRESASILAFLLVFLVGSGGLYLLDRLAPQTELNYVLQTYPPFPPPKPFPFDPNTLSSDSLRLLGLSEKVSKTIENYRNKGGKFRKKEDLKAIYGFPADQYELLAPYLRLPSPQKPKAQFRPAAKLDLNLADSTDLMGLRGIGKVFSQRIVNYRSALGGFHSLGQLAEVYGMKPELYESLLPQLKIQQPHTLIRINEVESIKHPYLRSYQAKAILQYRAQHGPFSGIAALRPIAVLDEETLTKLRPYLQF